MKVETNIKNNYVPVTLTITLETEEEFNSIKELCNCNLFVANEVKRLCGKENNLHTMLLKIRGELNKS